MWAFFLPHAQKHVYILPSNLVFLFNFIFTLQTDGAVTPWVSLVFPNEKTVAVCSAAFI